MRFSDEFLQEVMMRNDIVDIIGQSIKLQSAGVGKFKALCPFHRDTKTPSLSISADKQLFHCFGCGKGGTVIQFVMEQDGLDFSEAVKYLAEKANMDIPEDRGQGLEVRNDIKKILYGVNLEAAKYFKDELKKSKKAQEYASERGLSEQIIKRFGIGYAPNNLQILDILKEKGYTEEQINLAGITGTSEDGDIYLRFRDRLMFPIIDLRKNVIAFGGRAFGEAQPKYLNTSQTPIFNKSYNLFALNFAKNSNKPYLLLAEGYMDVISLHAAGFDMAVATLGTALTEQQCRLIRRYRSEVVICYDSDEAGQKATARAIDLLGAEGIKAKVLVQNDCKDPDEYIKKYGGGAFGDLVEKAPIAIEHIYEDISKRFDLGTSEGKIGFARAMAGELAKIDSEIEREIYGRKVSEEAGVGYEAIVSEMTKARKRTTNNEQRTTVGENAKAFSMNLKSNAERELIALMMQDKNALDIAKKNLKENDFEGELWRRLAEAMFEGKTAEEIKSSSDFAENMNEIAEMCLGDNNIQDIKLAAMELVRKVKTNSKKRRLDEAARENNIEEIQKIMQEES